MPSTRLVFLALVIAALASPADAHEVRPAYLALQQVEEARFDVLWKIPAVGGLPLGLAVRFPSSCADTTPRSTRFLDGASITRWSINCPGGLTERTIAVEGLSRTATDVLVRLERLDESTQVARLSPSQPSFVVEATPSVLRVAATYLGLGVEHILLGIDHLLFVLALLILVDGRRRLVWTITAFTIAHSLTLGAATVGWVAAPRAPVEAVIALSIVFVAAEIARTHQGRAGITRRQPWIVAFTFGLLHGFGFAGALTDIGLPAQAVPLALLFFNLGVEIGQLAFIAAIGLLVLALRPLPLPRPAWGWRVPAYGIGTLAAFWTIERCASFFG